MPCIVERTDFPECRIQRIENVLGALLSKLVLIEVARIELDTIEFVNTKIIPQGGLYPLQCRRRQHVHYRAFRLKLVRRLTRSIVVPTLIIPATTMSCSTGPQVFPNRRE